MDKPQDRAFAVLDREVQDLWRAPMPETMSIKPPSRFHTFSTVEIVLRHQYNLTLIVRRQMI